MTSGTSVTSETSASLASPARPARHPLARPARHPRAGPASLARLAGHPKLLVPLQSGYPVQLQNALPAFRPFFATIFRIGLPHFGHFGTPSATMLIID